MVHAINKQGREAYFTERVWELMPKHKNGWVEFSSQGEVLIPQQIVEFQQKKKLDAVVGETETEPTVEENVEPKAEVKRVMPKVAKPARMKKPIKIGR